ncbi:hypothetical protein SKAU_G00237420 [Synaphobranchus kaupii]|uniref:ATPase AAA-type core domain-containing protein n=1 Tax=Synaphobranchus kaupii TaxID=118154 RepID=A0A9Q1F790_SYNKA|nr:hypothetical protein SKAU_G00237420 [Synaphobranchus kaupii]
MRPDVFSGLQALPRSILLFGPQGTGRMLLSRCLASQLGGTFLRLSGSALVTKWLVEGEKIVQASFLWPGAGSQRWCSSARTTSWWSAPTSKPENIDESLRRYFMKRLFIPLPDSTARHQIITQMLSQHNYCLNDKEVALLVQRTEGVLRPGRGPFVSGERR